MKAQDYQAVVLGASAGALEALAAILPRLPASYPMPLLAVVHLPPDRPSLLPMLLQERCALQVREAEDKEPLEPGTVYFAPPDYHLLVEKEGLLSLSGEEPVLFSRPSIDVLFESAADAFGKHLIGVVLSGANQDGSLGLRAIMAAGGLGLVQDPGQASASVMPHAALELCPNARCLNLERIGGCLLELGSS